MLLQSVPNPNYMHGTSGAEAPEADRFSLATNDRGIPPGGMGTTGSLGVNYAAPLTRGGFPGEIFFTPPMPTGNWKNAPTPVMLGTGDSIASVGVALSLVGLAFTVAVYYGAFKYYFSDDCKCKTKA